MPKVDKPDAAFAAKHYLLGYTIEFMASADANEDGWWRISKYAGKEEIPQELSGLYPDLETCQRSIFKYEGQLR